MTHVKVSDTNALMTLWMESGRIVGPGLRAKGSVIILGLNFVVEPALTQPQNTVDMVVRAHQFRMLIVKCLVVPVKINWLRYKGDKRRSVTTNVWCPFAVTISGMIIMGLRFFAECWERVAVSDNCSTPSIRNRLIMQDNVERQTQTSRHVRVGATNVLLVDTVKDTLVMQGSIEIF